MPQTQSAALPIRLARAAAINETSPLPCSASKSGASAHGRTTINLRRQFAKQLSNQREKETERGCCKEQTENRRRIGRRPARAGREKTKEKKSGGVQERKGGYGSDFKVKKKGQICKRPSQGPN
ncbi:hypothetical protein M0R45_035723 [Rubus argutus]|uniref:Uncharacterized protein n=1 Tax=Rubus argutus TaxID=59490 RepID=A0AAW1VV26_RUBAR